MAEWDILAILNLWSVADREFEPRLGHCRKRVVSPIRQLVRLSHPHMHFLSSLGSFKLQAIRPFTLGGRQPRKKLPSSLPFLTPSLDLPPASLPTLRQEHAGCVRVPQCDADLRTDMDNAPVLGILISPDYDAATKHLKNRYSCIVYTLSQRHCRQQLVAAIGFVLIP